MSDRLVLIAAAATPGERRGAWPRPHDPAEPIAADAIDRIRRAVRDEVDVRCAPERAAVDTADALGLRAVMDSALAAWSMGSWAGQRLDVVAADDPAAVVAWRQDPAMSPPGGESLLEVLERASGWLEGAAPVGRGRVAVASASVVRALVVAALGADPAALWRLDVAAMSVSVLTRRDREWRVRSVGASTV